MQVPQKQTVDISFKNVSYTTRNRKTGNILKCINGHFSSGNLIGILGPSGAGKTTLLNLLAGYIRRNVKGEINVNGQPRNMQTFKKLSCYIMQEDALQQQLSVYEIMMLAANLKLGNLFTQKEKCKIVRGVVETIGLQACLYSRTEHLSGGESKRLAIALELINNPPVMFLDEPTTGLDNVVAKQCIELLKILADQGRTIICTIHQPSAFLLSFFDQVYFMSDGYCVYSGSVPQMVPFLDSMNLPCPTTYNPADYIIELVNNNDDATKVFSEAAENGILTRKDVEVKKNCNMAARQETCDRLFMANDPKTTENFPNPYHTQVTILLTRMFTQIIRNKLMLTIQLVHHVIGSLSIGLSFYAIGNDGSQALAIYKFFLALMVFHCYTYLMSPTLLFPFEIELIKREYFNRWYSLKAYYTALTISSIPSMVLFIIVFNVIVYPLTGQPMDLSRFINFNVICILVSFNSYGLGITIGSIFSSTAGACVGATAGFYMSLLCMHGMGYGDSISTLLNVLMLMVFPRHGIIGVSTAVLQGRPLMSCSDQLFCFIRDPEELMYIMGIKGARLDVTIYILSGLLLLHRLTAYIALKFKVAPDSRPSFNFF